MSILEYIVSYTNICTNKIIIIKLMGLDEQSMEAFGGF